MTEKQKFDHAMRDILTLSKAPLNKGQERQIVLSASKDFSRDKKACRINPAEQAAEKHLALAPGLNYEGLCAVTIISSRVFSVM